MAKRDDNGANFESNLVVIGLAAFIFAVIMWAIFGPTYSSTMGIIRRYEMMVFAPLFDNAAALLSKLIALDGRPLEFGQTVIMLSRTGEYVRWLYVPLVIPMAIFLYSKSFRGRFRRVHSMTSLAKQEAKLWPEIAPVAGKQEALVAGDITQGPWAVALTEWEFADKHALAKRGEKLKRDAARDVFVKQLGPLWAGPAALPPHARALFAAFVLRIAGKNDESQAAFRRMAESFASGGLKAMDVSFADAAIAKYGTHPMVTQVFERHAYVFTVMATLQQIARADGVLASPMYLWCKTVDRRLWYTLNNVGRYAFHVECAGIMAHWLFEKTVGAACPSPMVEKAIDGLETALTEFSVDDSLERIYH